jgi:hypothetical protein
MLLFFLNLQSISLVPYGRERVVFDTGGTDELGGERSTGRGRRRERVKLIRAEAPVVQVIAQGSTRGTAAATV